MSLTSARYQNEAVREFIIADYSCATVKDPLRVSTPRAGAYPSTDDALVPAQGGVGTKQASCVAAESYRMNLIKGVQQVTTHKAAFN